MVDQRWIIETGLYALKSIVDHVDALQALRPSEAQAPGPPYRLISNGEIPARIEAICSKQALAYGCLFDDGKRHMEPLKQRHLREERIKLVKSRCDGVEVPELRNKGVRNALAHFDERLLKSLIANPTASTIQDLSVSHKSAIQFLETTILIRLYCFDVDTVYLFDEKLHPSTLKLEAEAVLARWPDWKPMQ